MTEFNRKWAEKKIESLQADEVGADYYDSARVRLQIDVLQMVLDVHASYDEPNKIDAQRLPIDTVVMVSNDNHNIWEARHFAGVNPGNKGIYCYMNGRTSFTQAGETEFTYYNRYRVIEQEKFTFIDEVKEELARLAQWKPEHQVKYENANDLLNYVEDEHDAVTFIREADIPYMDWCDGPFPMSYTFHYLFACYAISYACNTYLAYKEEAA